MNNKHREIHCQKNIHTSETFTPYKYALMYKYNSLKENIVGYLRVKVVAQFKRKLFPYRKTLFFPHTLLLKLFNIKYRYCCWNSHIFVYTLEYIYFQSLCTDLELLFSLEQRHRTS